MKLFSVLLMSLWMSSAFAQQQSDYEIPVGDHDYRMEGQRTIDHSVYKLKLIKCNGMDYGVLYEEHWGYSFGSKFLGVCEWKFRTSLEKCNGDFQPSTNQCYNKVVDYFNLASKYPKIPVDFSGGKPQPPPQGQDVPDLDAPVGTR